MDKNILIILYICSKITGSFGSHGMGGSIQPKPADPNNPLNMNLNFRMVWKFGQGLCTYPCTPDKIGTFFTSSDPWICSNGCGSPITIGHVSYTVTSITSDVEKGTHGLLYTFPSPGIYSVEYSNCCWLTLAKPAPNFNSNMRLRTTFPVGARPDTGKSNTSPATENPAVLTIQEGCAPQEATTIRLPLIDSDGDNVTCRWAVGVECEGVCDGLPNAIIDVVNGSCVIIMDTQNYTAGGYYGVAITLEDFPKNGTTVTIPSVKTYTPSTRFSTVPVQFLVKAVSMISACNATLEWADPTPAAGSLIAVYQGRSVSFSIHPRDPSYPLTSVVTVVVDRPPAAVLDPISGTNADSQGRPDTRMITLTWQTSSADAGVNNICFQFTNTEGRMSPFRCIVVFVASGTTLIPPNASRISTLLGVATTQVTDAYFLEDQPIPSQSVCMTTCALKFDCQYIVYRNGRCLMYTASKAGTALVAPSIYEKRLVTHF